MIKLGLTFPTETRVFCVVQVFALPNNLTIGSGDTMIGAQDEKSESKKPTIRCK